MHGDSVGLAHTHTRRRLATPRLGSKGDLGEYLGVSRTRGDLGEELLFLINYDLYFNSIRLYLLQQY